MGGVNPDHSHGARQSSFLQNRRRGGEMLLMTLFGDLRQVEGRSLNSKKDRLVLHGWVAFGWVWLFTWRLPFAKFQPLFSL
jgi:hypothetical protein